jgi:hypothetical protein
MSTHKEEKRPVTVAALVASGAIISIGALIRCLLRLLQVLANN